LLVVRLAPAGDAAAGPSAGAGQFRVEVGVQPLAQQHECLGPQLRHPRLGDAQLGGDLRHRPLLEEIAGDDVSQPVGQRLDRVVQVAHPFPLEQQLLGSRRTLAHHVVGRAGREALQAQDDRALHVLVDGGDLVHGDAERLGEFGRRRGPAQCSGQLLLGGLDPARPAADRAAGPVQPAQLVEQRTPDAYRREAAERRAAIGVVALCRRGERRHPGRHQVLAVDVGRKATCKLADEVPDQGR
jgi:hypothetical protein